MSVVTSLLLSFDVLEDEPARIAEVNAFPFAHGLGLRDIADSNVYGGSKAIELPLWGGGFNYLDLDAFLAHLKTVRWERPDLVRIMVAEQEDEAFNILTL